MGQDKRTATYKILQANGPIMDSLLEVKEKSEGYRCKIYFPVGSDNVYGVLDKYVYRKKPDLDKLFICLSAVQETWEGTIDGTQYDPFLGDPPVILTRFEKRLPIMSKVILYYNEGIRIFRVAFHRSLDGAKPYFIRNMLQPLS